LPYSASSISFDTIFELSTLSLFLQTRGVNMIQTHKAITRTINVFMKWSDQTEQTNWSGGIGSKTLEASLAVKNMKFNSIELSNNSRHVHIPHKSFLSTLVKNLKLRLVTVSKKNYKKKKLLTDRRTDGQTDGQPKTIVRNLTK
jgi:hypothetical protein